MIDDEQPASVHMAAVWTHRRWPVQSATECIMHAGAIVKGTSLRFSVSARDYDYARAKWLRYGFHDPRMRCIPGCRGENPGRPDGTGSHVHHT